MPLRLRQGLFQEGRRTGAAVVRESFKEEGYKRSIINCSHACVILNKDLGRKKNIDSV